MLRLDIIGSAFAIGVFLLLYYMLVAFLVVYFVTVYGYTEQRANSLANWYWITNAIAWWSTGVVSDKLRVRKPFMFVGAVIAARRARAVRARRDDTGTSYYTFAVLFILGAVGGGMAYVAWMAAFTETVEKHNPAATATGLAIWGWILRVVVTVVLAALILVVPATSTLVDKGTRAQEIQAAHPDAVATLGALDGPTLATLQKNPSDSSRPSVRRSRSSAPRSRQQRGRRPAARPADDRTVPADDLSSSPQRHEGHAGAEGQPGPVADLVVRLRRRAGAVRPVHLRADRPVESASRAAGRAGARAAGRPRAAGARRPARGAGSRLSG